MRVPPLPPSMRKKAKKAKKARKARKSPERVVGGGAMFIETEQLLDVRPQSKKRGGGAAGDVAVVLQRTRSRSGKTLRKKVLIEPVSP